MPPDEHADGRTAYQTAASLYMQENTVNWSRSNIMVTAHSILVGSAGFVASNSLYVIGLLLPVVGGAVCFLWWSPTAPVLVGTPDDAVPEPDAQARSDDVGRKAAVDEWQRTSLGRALSLRGALATGCQQACGSEISPDVQRSDPALPGHLAVAPSVDRAG